MPGALKKKGYRKVLKTLRDDGDLLHDAAEVVPFEATVVADVAGPVGTDGGPVRPAPALGDDGDASVRRHARERPALDLDEQHAAVGHGNGALGKLEADRDRPHAAVLSTIAAKVTHAAALASAAAS